ncbi:Senescence domain-containing protein [Salix suchowensis]|nr:Senescence domain-containing protein [Salix suchowensis]
MTATHPEAFLLLTLENATVRTPASVLTGVLGLQCVTVTIASDSGTAEPAHDVFLVLQLNGFETPIDPARTITHERSENGTRTYTFHRTDFDNTQLVISITPPEKDQAFLEDLETFEGILAQYADFRGQPWGPEGHLILVNEDNGEVVGEFDRQFAVKEDPQLQEKGHENDPVYIEVQPYDICYNKSPAHHRHRRFQLLHQPFNTIPACFLFRTQPHRSWFRDRATATAPRALVFLTSESTRKGLSTVHAITGQAVQVSTKTVSVINDFVRRAVGGKPSRRNPDCIPTQTRARSSSGSPVASPSPVPAGTLLSPTAVSRDGKPPLPPRRSPSPSIPSLNGPPLPPRGPSPANHQLSNTARLILSADLILATLDHSTRQVLNTGTERFGAVMGHKYGLRRRRALSCSRVRAERGSGLCRYEGHWKESNFEAGRDAIRESACT